MAAEEKINDLDEQPAIGDQSQSGGGWKKGMEELGAVGMR